MLRVRQHLIRFKANLAMGANLVECVFCAGVAAAPRTPALVWAARGRVIRSPEVPHFRQMQWYPHR